MNRILMALAIVVTAAAAPGCKKSTPNCNAFKACCDGLASNPMMSGMAASCAQIPQLAQQGEQGDNACLQGFNALKQSAQAMTATGAQVPAACR